MQRKQLALVHDKVRTSSTVVSELLSCEASIASRLAAGESPDSRVIQLLEQQKNRLEGLLSLVDQTMPGMQAMDAHAPSSVDRMSSMRSCASSSCDPRVFEL